MTVMAMTFHESYGDLPKRLLTMVRKYNVSPADWDALRDLFGDEWTAIMEFIDTNSTSGYYNPSRYL